MKTIDFNIKFRDKIEKGTYKVTWNNLPVRIICWDFKGLKTPDATTPLPIIALVDCGDFEKTLHVTEDGVAYDRDLSGIMIERTFKLQVTYQDLPGKLTRVKYCLAKADVFTDNLMREYGYEYDSNKSHYYNRIGFINDFAKRYMNLFYRKLKLSDYWEYDDEEDWNLDFKEGDYVECICNDGPWVLTIGDIYKILYVEQSGYATRVTIKDIKDNRALTIGESDFIDMFKHSDSYKKELEKIEPKFRVGDYVVGKYISGYITEVRDDCYLLDYQGFPINKQDNYHLWSIQDAKDGDVLATQDHILIFEKLLPKDSGVSYCHYNFGCSTPQFDFNKDNNWYFGKESKVCPATKEQRDFLYQKMHEAGYTFDFEKKELKKIEQYPSEWSEEDEEHLHSIIESYKDLLMDYKACHDVDYIPYNSDTVFRNVVDDVNFLESIKDRVQPQTKQEWSEEDERYFKSITQALSVLLVDPYFDKIKLEHIAWFLSLKERVQPQNSSATDEELAQTKKDADNKTLM